MIRRANNVFVGFLMLFLWQFTTDVQAQDILNQHVQFSHSGEAKVGEALQLIAERYGFYFSYQDSILQQSRSLSLEEYEGSLEGLLEELLGKEFEFKELPGYVIIRYAPGTLDLDAQLEMGNRQLVIKGFVKDKHTGENVSFASIYDRDQLHSTLSDSEGYFELRAMPTNGVWLSLSKHFYKDTTFMILPAIEIEASKNRTLFRYYQEDGSVEEVEQSLFGRMFIGFQQRFQRINLGGFFAESPFQMSLTPGLSSQGMFNSQTINKFSLNLIGGYTAGLDGFEAAGIFNINQRDVSFFQMAGAVNVVGGNVKGLQVAGISNKVLKTSTGVQVAGIHNQVKQKTRGIQISGIVNQANESVGAQIAGILNHVKESEGLQIAGLFNVVASQPKGVQIAGLFNLASGTSHHQLAGIVNKAKVVKGIQLSGLINIAESSDYPVGLLNFIKDGTKSLSVQLNESSFPLLVFRSGGRVLYGLVGAGYQGWNSHPDYSYEAGIGIYMVNHSNYSMDMELVGQLFNDFEEINYNTSSIRVLNGISIHPNLKFFVAPTLNFTTFEKNEGIKLQRLELARKISDQRIWVLDLGITGGLQYAF